MKKDEDFEFKLNKIELASSAWNKTQKWAMTVLQRERERNDNIKNTEENTLIIRGRISLAKELIALDAEMREVKEEVEEE